MIVLLLVLFLSDGSNQVFSTAVPSLEACQAKAALAKETFVGQKGDNVVVVGATAGCVVIPKSNDI